MNAPVVFPAPVTLTSRAMAALMPMYVQIASTGHIEAVGPTLARLCPNLLGRRVLEAFEIRRPSGPQSFQQLLDLAGRRLTLKFRENAKFGFKGIIVPLADGAGAFLNLSFGISIIEAVSHHKLTAGDFAPTDLTVEMLYLVEAKSAAMEESRRLNSRLEGARSAAEKQALTDALTGLKNRRAMEESLSYLIDKKSHFGLVHMDLDKFKDVNDTQGHAAGDAVLEKVADVLNAELRDDDIATRVGGDEFVLLFPSICDAKELIAISERIIAKLEKPIPFGDQTCHISASAGITVSTYYAKPDAEQMLHDADVALYASKDAGRGCATAHAVSP